MVCGVVQVAEARITTLLIGLLIVGLATTAMTFFIFNLNNIDSSYNTYSSTSYDNSTLDKYNKLQEIENITNSMRGQVVEVKPGTEVTEDITGSFFTNAYASVKTFFTSASYTYDISKAASEDLQKVGANSAIMNYVETALIVMIIIIFIIGIGLYVIFKIRI